MFCISGGFTITVFWSIPTPVYFSFCLFLFCPVVEKAGTFGSCRKLKFNLVLLGHLLTVFQHHRFDQLTSPDLSFHRNAALCRQTEGHVNAVRHAGKKGDRLSVALQKHIVDRGNENSGCRRKPGSVAVSALVDLKQLVEYAGNGKLADLAEEYGLSNQVILDYTDQIK